MTDRIKLLPLLPDGEFLYVAEEAIKVTPAMIGAAHDVTMKEAGIILSHDLITKIYEAMQAQAIRDRHVSYACPVCAASLEARELPHDR